MNGTRDPVPECVAQALIQAVLANENLKDIYIAHEWDTTDPDWGWESHIAALCNGLKDHKGLCTLTVEVKKEAFGPNYSHLQELISHNHKITVTSLFDVVYGDDDSMIRELYALNRLYRGPGELLLLSPSKRPSLMATALINCAPQDFQLSAFLLAIHADVLCELLQLGLSEEATILMS
jgi:hypothetical protein